MHLECHNAPVKHRCLDCRRAYQRAWYLKNRETRNAGIKAWKARNADLVKYHGKKGLKRALRSEE